MPVRAPDDVLWVELPPVRSDVFLQTNILHLHRYFISKHQKHKYKQYISLEQLRMINMHRTSAIGKNAVSSKCVFLSLSESASIFLILTTCFFWETMASLDINVFIIAREISRKIGRSPYGVRLISYNAGRAPYDIVRCPAGHRPMFSYTDDGRRLYDMWPRKRKFVKNRPVPGDY